MTAPKTPDGIPQFDLGKVYGDATAVASGSTSKTDIWNIPTDLAGKQITTSYGKYSKINQGTRSRLEGADQDLQSDSSIITAPGQETFGVDPTSKTPNDTYVLPIYLYGSSPEKYLQLQRSLFAAGYFGSKSATSMRWGADTESMMTAWQALLRDTVQQQSLGKNVTWEDVLTGTAKAAGDAAGGQQQAAAVINYTDPAQVAGTVQRAAQAALGRNLTEDEVQTFVSEFRAQETTYGQESAQAQSNPGNYERALTNPNLVGQAEQYVEKNNEPEVAGNRMADYVSAIERLLG